MRLRNQLEAELEIPAGTDQGQAREEQLWMLLLMAPAWGTAAVSLRHGSALRKCKTNIWAGPLVTVKGPFYLQ